MRSETRTLVTLCLMLVLFSGVAAAQTSEGGGTLADYLTLLSDILDAIADVLTGSFLDS